MRKIRLDLQDLHVDSFAVTSGLKARIGTVHARSATYTLPIPYGICTSGSEPAQCGDTTTTNSEIGTCNHTVCDCDQDGWTSGC
ncbi:MAG TPA: hypothetical protein VF092_30255 [Longimicrobium sp.]